MNRILVFIGLAALVVIFANLNLLSIDFFEAPGIMWAIGGLLFYTMIIRKGSCGRKCASS